MQTVATWHAWCIRYHLPKCEQLVYHGHFCWKLIQIWSINLKRTNVLPLLPTHHRSAKNLKRKLSYLLWNIIYIYTYLTVHFSIVALHKPRNVWNNRKIKRWILLIKGHNAASVSISWYPHVRKQQQQQQQQTHTHTHTLLHLQDTILEWYHMSFKVHNFTDYSTVRSSSQANNTETITAMH